MRTINAINAIKMIVVLFIGLGTLTGSVFFISSNLVRLPFKVILNKIE